MASGLKLCNFNLVSRVCFLFPSGEKEGDVGVGGFWKECFLNMPLWFG